MITSTLPLPENPGPSPPPATMAERRELRSFDDLEPAPYNPRRIEPEALEGLGVSVETFGDISGIVWNCRSGHVIAGHQRLQALRDRGAVFDADACAVVLGDRRFPVRVVDWDERTEAAANLAANNPAIAGEFTEELQPILDDLAGWEGFDDLRLDALADGPPYIGDDERAPQPGAGSLADRFLVPPFSVLSAREGWWQDRKRAWIALGIQSELGRGETLLRKSNEANDLAYYDKKRAVEKRLGRKMTNEEFARDFYKPPNREGESE